MRNDRISEWLESEPWKDQSAYIIGGGSSLRNFDWKKLKSENTIGCNDAYKLSKSVCKVCIFGDLSWFRKHKPRLEKFKAPIVSNACGLAPGNIDSVPWVHYMPRRSNGLWKDALGWNGNTGASALNLALILGAKTVYLLGFDMGIRKGKTNWHDEIIHPNAVLPSSYKIFLERWPMAVSGLKNFPGCKVININDKATLPGIKTISHEEHWGLKDG